MITPVASPSAIPAGSQYQKPVIALIITPMRVPMTRATINCLRLAAGVGPLPPEFWRLSEPLPDLEDLLIVAAYALILGRSCPLTGAAQQARDQLR